MGGRAARVVKKKGLSESTANSSQLRIKGAEGILLKLLMQSRTVKH